MYWIRRQGKDCIRSAFVPSEPEQTTYNWPDRVEPADIEEELNAEHCVELARDMQLCAIVGGTVARNARSSEETDPEEHRRVSLLFCCMSVVEKMTSMYFIVDENSLCCEKTTVFPCATTSVGPRPREYHGMRAQFSSKHLIEEDSLIWGFARLDGRMER